MNELQSVTDIDEVIKYAERRAEGCHEMASSYHHTDEGVYLQEETRLQYRAIMWENIHEWLEELKELRKKERPHGEWINEDYGIGLCFAECSECGEEIEGYAKENGFGFDYSFPNFCPNCGARMQKEGEAE